MIFFITTISPSSDLSVELSNIRKELFQNFLYLPVPFPLFLTSINTECPQRPTRKQISEQYPQELSIKGYENINNQIILRTNQVIPLDYDDSIFAYTQNLHSGFVLSHTDIIEQLDLNKLPLPSKSTFKNYSLVCFEVNSGDNNPFWLNMSWSKIWEVKKGKNKLK